VSKKKKLEALKKIYKGPLLMLQQRDNVLYWQSKNVRFMKNKLRFFFAKNGKENLNEKGHYYIEQERD